MQFSNWVNQINRERGIIHLMKDLGNAAPKQGHPLYMLGGGNPARVPKIERYFRNEMTRLLQSATQFEALIGRYAEPQGHYRFSDALAKLLRQTYGWEISPQNIAIANGSQMAFTILFRLFSGAYSNGRRKRILLPMTPEYIGYHEADETAPRFHSIRPQIIETSPVTFKYQVDFEQIDLTDDIGAICVSRPTNPTGNVLSDDEIQRLNQMAVQHDVPLIIDGAYGLPFPNIVYTDATVTWNLNTILVLSLSKVGLPGTRTGIIIAREEVIELFTCANAIMTLASGNFGAFLTLNAIENGEILRLSNETIQPYYRALMENTIAEIHRQMRGIPYMLHNPEGAFFVWLWFPGLPIADEELYARLKRRNVYVVPGSFFFPGLREHWPHRFECIRISYAGNRTAVSEGLGIIAQEVAKAFAE